MEAFPSVFDGLCDLDHFDPKLALSAKRLLDTDTDDYEYELAKLKKWLSEQVRKEGDVGREESLLWDRSSVGCLWYLRRIPHYRELVYDPWRSI